VSFAGAEQRRQIASTTIQINRAPTALTLENLDKHRQSENIGYELRETLGRVVAHELSRSGIWLLERLQDE